MRIPEGMRMLIFCDHHEVAASVGEPVPHTARQERGSQVMRDRLGTSAACEPAMLPGMCLLGPGPSNYPLLCVQEPGTSIPSGCRRLHLAVVSWWASKGSIGQRGGVGARDSSPHFQVSI